MNFREVKGHSIRAANNSYIPAPGIGDFKLEVLYKDTWHTVTLKNTLYAPGINATLVSLGKFDEGDCTTTIRNKVMTIANKIGHVICEIPY